MQDYKYFIQIAIKGNLRDYILQSDFFDTEQKTVEWASSISYLTRHCNIRLMRVEYYKENDRYGDIEFIRYIDILTSR